VNFEATFKCQQQSPWDEQETAEILRERPDAASIMSGKRDTPSATRGAEALCSQPSDQPQKEEHTRRISWEELIREHGTAIPPGDPQRKLYTVLEITNVPDHIVELGYGIKYAKPGASSANPNPVETPYFRLTPESSRQNPSPRGPELDHLPHPLDQIVLKHQSGKTTILHIDRNFWNYARPGYTLP